jgi:predicted MFS family arabinose efflux permease
MKRVVEVVFPTRLGVPYRWLVTSSWVSNLGDGIALAAGPLLVASQTRDPLLVALATLLQQLPILLFGLIAGALADRWDRRRVVIVADLLRAGVLVVLSLTIVTGHVSIAVILTTLFVLGTAETFSDTTSATLMPMVLEPSDYGIGTTRLFGGFIVANQLVGPPIGAALFAAGMTVPFVAQAVFVTLGAGLISRMRLPPHESPSELPHLRRDIGEGLRWVRHSPPVRTLALTIVAFNVTYGAAWSVLVLYSMERLHLHEVGYGLLTTAGAVGGLVGIASYGWLAKRLSLADIMRAGLVLETLTHLGLALTTTPWVALAICFVFGAHAFIWGTTATTIRQRSVPSDFQGRVGSVYTVSVYGGAVVGGLLGGLTARQWGITGPFWFAFVGSAVLLVLLWRELGHIAHVEQNENVTRSGSAGSDGGSLVQA